MKRFKITPWIAGLLILAMMLVAWFIIKKFSPQHKDNTTVGIAQENTVVKKYCSSCHLFPEPQLLDKKTWQDKVLPNMAMRLGLRAQGQNPYVGMDTAETRLVRSLNVYPEQPLISQEDWQQIVDYYAAQAPAEPLPQQAVSPIQSGLQQFKAQPVYIGENQLPNTSMLKYNSRQAKLYVGDGSKQLYLFNKDLSLASNWFMPSPPVDVDFSGNFPNLLCIGSIAPTQQRTGNFFTFDPSEKPTATAIRFDSLARPVSVTSGDLNGDKKNDVLICSFGNYTGRLSWFESYDQHREHVLLEQPGARNAEIVDINKDGLPDIVALMAQAREELILFMNKGQGRFEQKILYQFPSVYGVSYFELADFNKDGHPDILLTNGDNWDLSPVKKYYHGIRILMNDSQNNFKEVFFYPSYGAEKAVARDFDDDGDLDIAAISFSDDLNKTEDGFLLLDNDGEMNFTAHSSPDAAYGKWITMEVADLDKDGDDDIVIGSFIYNLSEMTKLVGRDVDRFPNFVVFWNKLK